MEQEQKEFEYGIEITLPNPDDFLKIKESLTRVGMKSKKANILYQSCNILHRRGKYYILHFKEMFLLDKKPSTITDDDLRRRNAIVKLLEKWGLCVIINKSKAELVDPESPIDIIPHKMKKDWNLICKYQVGKRS